jgi:periplasmic divalent cation tolerance protein
VEELEALELTFTAPSPADAERLGRLALADRLAACAQVSGPISSSYWWQGDIATATEWRCTLKTTASRLPALMAAVRSAHPYEVPEIVVRRLDAGDPDYLAWIEAETRPAASTDPG